MIDRYAPRCQAWAEKNRPPGRGIRRTILCWGQRSRTGKVRGVTPLQGMGEEKRGEVIWLDASVVGIGNRRDSGYDRKKLTDERLAERLAGREDRVIVRFVAPVVIVLLFLSQIGVICAAP